MSELLLDAAGRRRSPATLPQFHAGRAPRNKGMRYPADPPTIEEIITVMRRAGDSVHGRRLRGLIVVLWRAGLRINEALALTEADLDPRRGSLLVRRGKGGRRREVGMDDWAWEQLAPWLQARVQLPVGPLFCVVNGATRGRPWAAAAARSELRRIARQAGVRRRFAPHQLRHAHAVEMAREGVPLIVIQRQLGHSNLGITSPGRDGARCRRPPVRFPGPPSEPDVPVPEHPALHRTCDGRSWCCRHAAAVAGRVVARPVPVSAHGEGCCDRDTDIGSRGPRRASESSCLRGWSSGAPSTVA